MRTPIALASLLIAAAFAGCSGDEPLAACFKAKPLNADKSQYEFDATCSTGDIHAYRFDFGDLSPPDAKSKTSHTYQHLNGNYKVKLTVSDKSGNNKTTEQSIPVGSGQNRLPILFANANMRLVEPGQEIVFDATQSYDPDGDPVRVEWDFNSRLADEQLHAMENLGNQQYGRYAHGPPPGQTSPDGGDEEPESSQGRLMTPSGHVYEEELADAWQRFQERVGLEGFHGGNNEPPPPRNTELDGRIKDTAPIQIFSYPSPATYFVHLRLLDIKGASVDGFIRISVEADVPENPQTTKVEDQELQTGLLPQNLPVGAVKSREHSFNQTFAGDTQITLSFEADPPGTPATTQMGFLVCAQSMAEATCQSQTTRRAEPGASPVTYTATFNPDQAGEAGAYKVIVQNTGQSNVVYALEIVQVYDMNPWIRDEMGLGGDHH
jgi:PKD repeat protein